MKIFCVGRNYAEHAAELGNAVPDEPVIFIKPATALQKGDGHFAMPAFSRNLHFEVELVLRVSRPGKNLSVADASNAFDAIGIGIDLTARDVQSKLKAAGLPWEKAKAFDYSAPVSADFIAIRDFDDLNNIAFGLRKNGATMQEGNTADMIFSFAELLAHISEFFSLQRGDLIFTGTPAGVGPVAIGDILTCYIGERQMLRLEIEGSPDRSGSV